MPTLSLNTTPILFYFIIISYRLLEISIHLCFFSLFSFGFYTFELGFFILESFVITLADSLFTTLKLTIYFICQFFFKNVALLDQIVDFVKNFLVFSCTKGVGININNDVLQSV